MNLTPQDSVATPWSACLHGSFRLTTPIGEPVRLQNAKVEALLGVLVQHREFGIPRDELAAIVWPGKRYEDQKASLRQALSLCRKAIGADSIEASRSHCRLSDSFHVEILPGSGVFMPGHEGDYFDEIRGEELAADRFDSEHRSVLGAWLQVLEWNATHDPGLFFDMLRIAPHQAEGIAFADLERLLAKASSVKKSAWAEYWWGTVLDNLEDCQLHLKTALEVARDQRDYDLISKICLELGRAYSRTGHLKRALAVSTLADEVAAKSRSVVHVVNALRLKATLNFHWGDPVRGNALFQDAIQKAPTTMEQYQLTASLALFQAGYGFDSQAESNLARIHAYADSLGHIKMNSLVQLTQRILLARSTDPQACYDVILRELDSEPDAANEQIWSYTHELLSSLCDGDRAKVHRTRALEARQKTRDVSTHWVRVLRGDPVAGTALT